MKTELVAEITESFDLTFKIPRLYHARLQEIGTGKLVRVDIKKWVKPRTIKQNAYLWSVVYPHIIRYIKDSTGQDFTAEQLHERYKKKYLGYEACEVPGMEDLVKPKSSTELNVEAFWWDFLEKICKEWAEMGLYIPLPERGIK